MAKSRNGKLERALQELAVAKREEAAVALALSKAFASRARALDRAAVAARAVSAAEEDDFRRKLRETEAHHLRMEARVARSEARSCVAEERRARSQAEAITSRARAAMAKPLPTR